MSAAAATRKRPADDDEENMQETTTGDGAASTPITPEGTMPQKKFYRQRAHCNPLSHNDSFDYPISPSHMDWTASFYPNLKPENATPTVLDIGCGFGGLTVALAKLLPKERVLGMEIRAKVTEYVRLRVLALRKEHEGEYQNCSVLRTNSMKYLPNFFRMASLNKLFFCFPDPHFKRKNHPRRIITERLLSEYAYVLKVTGRLYCITDVKELHDWHVLHCDAHPLFRRMSDDELKDDPCVHAMTVETEEGKKVARNGGDKYHAVYERMDDSIVVAPDMGSFFEGCEYDDDKDEENKKKQEAKDEE